MDYDIIVVGGGHAGIEAAYAASKLGNNTLLVTGSINNIGDMPCNPSIGGTSKGIIVREIDALGGLMGKITDKAALQIKMLNKSKGPAVHSLRAQADKETYPKFMIKTLQNLQNLTIMESIVENIIVNNQKIGGVVLDSGEKITSKCVILTTGTYLKSDILIGDSVTPSGPHGEKRSNHLSDQLKGLGFNIIRLKTGTPPRIARDSIDYNLLRKEPNDLERYSFSFDEIPNYDVNKQVDCYVVNTNSETHNIINNNLLRSSMYGGIATGIGPRYCPSIEDKIVRFNDKEKHILFLEPQSNVMESKYYNSMYLQGFSTSMPKDVQEEMLHSLVGFKNAKILEYAYAIEYDAIYPTQIKPSLESKLIENLFTAGQINGTSGYEEAAGQGIIAGINANQKIRNKEPLILKRNEAYIGVLIDDLVTKGTIEPYRMLTSRAEFRLILRHDNADLRLRKYGYKVGLIDEKQYNKLLEKEKEIKQIIKKFKETKISKNDLKKYFDTDKSYLLSELIKRPEINIHNLSELIDTESYNKEALEEVLIELKYEGYIKKTYQQVEKLTKAESKKIPSDIDYDKVSNLASEARIKLKEIKPLTIAQASRISGVNPSDISCLTIYLKKEYKND